MSSVGELVVSIIGDISQLKKSFAEVGAQVGQMGQKLQSVGASVSSMGSSLTKGITAPILAAGAGIAVVTNSAVGFEKQMAEVFTLLPDLSQEGMGQLTADTLEFSKELGVTTNQAVPALYQAISAGVPKDNVFDFLTVAQKAAVGGVTELETAVDGISSVINAYGTDVLSAGEASDLMFTAVKLGKTTFEELSKSLYNVIPTASALGVEFGDVTAAIAAMTAQGTPTSVATTQMRQLFVELSKEGSATSDVFKEIAGISFREFIAQGGNTQEALQLLEQYAKKSGVGINDLFSSVEAGNAALALTGKGTDVFTKDLEAMAAATGSTQAAYKTMDDTVARSMEKIKAELNALMIELGNEFLPILKDDILPIVKDTLVPFLTGTVAPTLRSLVKLFTDMPAPLQLAVVGITGLLAALGPILLVAGPIISGIESLVTIIGGAGGLSAIIGGLGTTLLSVVGPMGIVLAALAAVGYVVYKNWDKIAPILKETFNNIKTDVEPVVSMIKQFVSDSLAMISDWWNANGETVSEGVIVLISILGKLVSFIADVVAGTVKTVLPPILVLAKYILEQILNLILLFSQALTGDWEGAWDTLKTIVQTQMDLTRNIISTVLDSISGIFSSIGSDLYDSGKALIQSFIDGIRSQAESLKNAVSHVLGGIDNYLPHSPAKIGPLSELPNWDAYFLDPLQRSVGRMSSIVPEGLQSVAGAIHNVTSTNTTSSTVNTYAGDEFFIQNVNLSSDYPFERFVRDLEQYNRQKHVRRGY